MTYRLSNAGPRTGSAGGRGLGEIREDETLNDVMVRAGHGFRTKKELLEDARKSEANESDAA